MEPVLGFRKFDATLMVKFAAEASRTLKKDHWVVCKSFVYYIGEKGSNRLVRIPLGYLTDGASVPQIFWNIIPPWGQYGQAAVVHDYLCEHLMIEVDGVPTPITREECDHILKEAMQVLEVPKFKIAMIYGGVAAYRKVWRVSKPQFNRFKYSLELEYCKKLEMGIEF